MTKKQLREELEHYLLKAAKAESDEEFLEMLEMATLCRRLLLDGET